MEQFKFEHGKSFILSPFPIVAFPLIKNNRKMLILLGQELKFFFVTKILTEKLASYSYPL